MSDSFPRYRERLKLLGQKPVGLNTVLGTYKKYQNGVLQLSVDRRPTGTQPNALYEKTWDQNNAPSRGKTRNARGSRTFRVGGPFVSIKVNVPGMALSPHKTYSWTEVGPGGSFVRHEYTGSFTNPYLGFDSGLSFPSDLYLTGGPGVLKDNPLVESTSALESRAWDIKPKVERAGFLNALYEFREVPAMLRQTGRLMKDLYVSSLKERYTSNWYQQLAYEQMPSRVSDDFLNYHFGWVPFCKDINQMVEYLIFSQQFIDDIANGNNSWIKRRGTLLDTEETLQLGKAYAWGVEPQGGDLDNLTNVRSVDGNFCRGVTHVHAFVERHAWAEGAFKYYRPEFDKTLPDYTGIVASVNRHITASGMRISPLHVWKAIPWSWAIDWFSNVGKLIERADDQFLDSMVTKYLYLMHHKTIKIRNYHTLFWKSGEETLQFDRFIDCKQRRGADSPYGFVLGGDLNSTQWSILAALGLGKNVKFARTIS